MHQNKRGFTLVEIIVSFAIAAIVLTIIGTIILASSGYLISSSNTDLNKQSVDSIIDFVRSEIEYSSDVRLITANNKYVPSSSELESGDWHWIYVKEGQLYRDDKAVFSNDFYQGGNLEMITKGNYQNSQRLDIEYTLQIDNEDVYSSKDTVVLLNFSASEDIMKNGLYTNGAYKSLSQEQESEERYVIYYNKKYNTTTNSESNTSELTGTVADIQELLYYGNYRGLHIDYNDSYYLTTLKPIYKTGEIVYYNGFWWEYINDHGGVNTLNPGDSGNYCWRCLDANYTHQESGVGANKLTSAYRGGDIVIYNGNYYQLNGDETKVYDNKSDLKINSGFWQLKGKVGNESVEKEIKKKSYAYEKKDVYGCNTVLKKYLISNVVLKDPNKKKIEEYEYGKTYKKGSIVRLANLNAGKNSFYDIYIKISDDTLHEIPDKNPEYGWLKIDVNYSRNSSYASDDIVVTAIYSSSLYAIQAKQNIFVENANKLVSDINNNPNGVFWKTYKIY